MFSGLLTALNRFFTRIFPRRASTQTWMSLTLVFFVGIVVVAVGLYFAFILRNEIQVAFRQTMSSKVSHIAGAIENVQDRDDFVSRVRNISRITNLRVTVVRNDTLVADYFGDQILSDGQLLSREEMQFEPGDATRFAERIVAGRHTHFAATRHADSALVVRIAETEPPLFTLIRRMQVTLAVSMIAALLLAIFGSWTAAQQVTEPLTAIRNSARSISEGDLEEEIVVDSRAIEFQDLVESLNNMAAAFKEKIDELERLAMLQNEFIGNVSHEVRNPIFSVGGYLEALAASNLTATQRRFYAEKGLSNLGRLNNLFNDLIEIARLEYREDLINPSIFDLTELIDDVYEFEIGKAEGKGLELIVDDTPMHACADRSRIRQVIINLIENAIAYSDEGTVRCTFARRQDKVRIDVVDTGRGIPEGHLDHIFERFYRVDPDRSRRSGGTGLGLSIVKQILHAHGETIHVESRVGSGTRFWFEIPFAEAPTDIGTA